MSKKTIHLIGNAHLDPVWLWNWREGTSEMVTTVRTILKLMDEFEELTFVRGETAVYEVIEKYDPESFKKIKKYHQQGRWEVVASTYIQPDHNLPATETLLKHFEVAKEYTNQKFGMTSKVCWAPDAFGHSAGLPEILAASEIEALVFIRPQPFQLELPSPFFRWKGKSGASALGYRITGDSYGTERDDMNKRLDDLMESLSSTGMQNVGCFYGLGNHGGGPTRRHLREIRKWSESHPEVNVVHSGLHRLIDALKKEHQRSRQPIPEFADELSFCFRGCYSAAGRFKTLYRKSESKLIGFSKLALVGDPAIRLDSTTELNEAWKGVLFNSFHDILPGSSIESAYEQQTASMGAVEDRLQKFEFDWMTALAEQIDTQMKLPAEDHPSAVPQLVFNPHPFEYVGAVEFEFAMDYRPVFKYLDRANEVPLEVRNGKNRPMAFQIISNENLSLRRYPWRKRVVVPVKIPPYGWEVLNAGWVENPSVPKLDSDLRVTATSIENKFYRVEFSLGDSVIQIKKNGKNLFSGKGIQFATYRDEWGSWGGMRDEAESRLMNEKIGDWVISDSKILEQGAQRADLWVRLTCGHSRLDLTFKLYEGRDAVDVDGRGFWDEKSARLKMSFPVGAALPEYQVPGGSIKREVLGEVPGGRWVKIQGEKFDLGLATSCFYNYDLTDQNFRTTLIRSSRYADDNVVAENEFPWAPAADSGEFKFKFILSSAESIERNSELLENPILIHPAVPKRGKLPRQGSLFEIKGKHLKLLSLRAQGKKRYEITLQETQGKSKPSVFLWRNKTISLPALKPYSIQKLVISV